MVQKRGGKLWRVTRRYVLQKGHVCSNFRQDDSCATRFSASVARVTNPFVLLCSCLLLALVPKFCVYESLVLGATGVFDSTGFDPNRMTDSLSVLQRKLEHIEMEFEQKKGQDIMEVLRWSDFRACAIN